MGTLCTRLLDVNEAGTYHLNCSQTELRAAVGQAGFALFETDLAARHGKGEFLAALAQAISAPEWFGHNFDALADSLGDFSWRPAPGYVLLLHNGGETLGLSAGDHSTVTEIFSDAVSFWRSQAKPFWVFFC